MKTPLLLVKTLLSLMLFSIITTSSIAQNWQQIYFEDFNAHSRIPREFIVQNFSSSLIGYGASGANDDKCASSPFLTYGTYIAYKALLEDGVTYRFGWNLKTKEPGRKIQYMYGSALSLASATHSGSSMGIPVLGLTGPGEDIYSEEIEGTGDVVFLIAAVPSRGNDGTTRYNVHFDNFTIEKLNVSYLNFDVASIEIEEGGSTEVCISLSDHASNAFDVELAFEGGQSPHFTSTQPISLSFNEGDTQQCFTLQTEPDNGVEDDILNYVLNILPPDVGTGMELGDVTTLQIQVLEGDGCPYAGMDRTICEGECVILGCEPEADTENYCYKWEPMTGMEEGQEFLAQPEVCPEVTTTYIVYITNDEGDFIDEDEVTITVIPKPEFEIISNSIVVCPGTEVELKAGESYNENWEYLWSTGSEEYSIYITDPGDYSCTVTDKDGCQYTATIDLGESENDTDRIRDYFISNNFFAIPITVVGDEPAVQSGGENNRNLSPCESAPCEGSSGLCVRDEANLIFDVEGHRVNDLESIENDHLLFFADNFGYDNSRVYVTKNENFCSCEDFLSFIESENFNQAETAFWIHLDDIEGSDNDVLYIRSNLPTLNPHYPADADGVEDMEGMYSYFLSNVAYSSGADILFAIQNLMLTDSYVVPPKEPSLGAPYTLCSGTTLETQALSPTGVPVKFPENTIFRYRVYKSIFRNEIDHRALSGFALVNSSPDQQYSGRIYSGRVRVYSNTSQTEFRGYYDNYIQGPPYDYSIEGLSSDLSPGAPTTVMLGGLADLTSLYTPFINDQGEIVINGQVFTLDQVNSSCPIYSFWMTTFAPDVTHTQGIGNGQLVADFEEVGDFVENNTDLTMGSVVIPTECNSPPLSAEAFRNPDAINIFENGDWILRYINPGGCTIFIQGYHVGSDPEPTYRKWNHIDGVWVPYLPADYELQTCSFFEAFVRTAISTDNIHNALAGLGFIPIIGEVADIIDGAIYFIEGDNTNGTIAMLGSLPFIGAEIRGLHIIKKYRKSIGEIVESKSVIRYANYGDINKEIRRIEEGLDDAALTERLSSDEATQLYKWMFKRANHRDVLLKFINNPNLIISWKLIKDAHPGPNSRRIFDMKLIEKVEDLRTNQVVLDAIGGQAELIKILKKNNLAPCCGEVGNAATIHRKPIDEYLNDVKQFCINFTGANNVQNSDKIINLMKNGHRYQIDEVAQTIRLANGSPQTATNYITDFQPPLGNPVLADNVLDIDAEMATVVLSNNNVGDLRRLTNNQNFYTELKSYKKESVLHISTNSTFFNQFKAYLANNNVNSWDNISYVFDARKLSKAPHNGVSDDVIGGLAVDNVAAAGLVKTEFEKIFRDGNKMTQLKTAMDLTQQGRFQSFFGTNNPSAFTNTNTPIPNVLFNFISVQ